MFSDNNIYQPQQFPRNQYNMNNELESTDCDDFDDGRYYFQTPEKQQSYILQKQSEDQEGPFIIDVKPKKKSFNTPEEKKKFIQDYTKKIKTEICKNWHTTGYCKFGDKCSFAHGFDQLQDKQHLHNNYKTKPCKKYFLKGFCSYGNRCQYLHMDILNLSEFREFVTKVYKEKKLHLPAMEFSSNPVKRFWRLKQLQKKYNPLYEDDIFNFKARKRLNVFQEICESNNENTNISNSQSNNNSNCAASSSNNNNNNNNNQFLQANRFMFLTQDSQNSFGQQQQQFLHQTTSSNNGTQPPYNYDTENQKEDEDDDFFMSQFNNPSFWGSFDNANSLSFRDAELEYQLPQN